jgi:hypothetical protein
MTDWEKIVNHFEATAKCVHGNNPRVFYEPGCLVVETKGNCKCEHWDGEGLPLTQVLAEWQKRFTT